MLSSIITSNLQCSPRMGFPFSAIRLASTNSGPGVAGEREGEERMNIYIINLYTSKCTKY